MRTRCVQVLVLATSGVAGCGSVRSPDPGGPAIDASVEVDAPGSLPVDAAGNPPIDSPSAATVKYDIGYINDITLTPNISSVRSILAIVNKGTAALKLSTVTVVTYGHDFPGIDWRFSNTGVTTTALSPGQAAGLLNADAATKLVGSGLVPETIVDNTLDFTMTFPTAPPAGVTLHAQAVLQIESANIVLPFTIKVVASGAPVFNTAGRISSQD